MSIGAETHFKVVVVSDSFHGMPLIKVATRVIVSELFPVPMECKSFKLSLPFLSSAFPKDITLPP